MAYKAKDGKQFGNVEMGRHYDKTRPGGSFGKIGKPGADTNADHEGHSEHDHAGQEGDHEEIKSVVAEHGKAHKATVEHDGQHHTVTTHHEDGHQHVSHGHPHVGHVAEHLSHAAGAATEAKPDLEAEGAASADESDRGASLMPSMEA